MEEERMKRYMKNRNQFLQSKKELLQNTEPILRRVERLSKQIIYPSRILLFFLVTSLTLFL